MLLKDLQPHREKPSKDRSRRFAAGELYADKQIPDDHDVTQLSFWTNYPSKHAVRDVKCLLGQVICILQEGKLAQSTCSNNHRATVMLNIYSYDTTTKCYTVAGQSGLCNVAKILHLNITPNAHISEEGILKLDASKYSALELDGFVPYEECERLLLIQTSIERDID